MQSPKTVLICRTDAIGDVILTFPVCGIIKQFYPHCRIFLLGRNYTRDAAQICKHIDEFLEYDELAGKNQQELRNFFQIKKIDTVILLMTDLYLGKTLKKAGIKKRIGTSHSLHHWRTCNHLVFYSKRGSNIHEVEINLKFLKGIGIKAKIQKEDYYKFLGATKIPALKKEYMQLLSREKFNLILHPLSHGNAKEWGLENFSKLIALLDKNQFKIFVSGSAKEKEILVEWMQEYKNDVTDVTGLFKLDQFISFVSHADGLVAGSTGPLHIAAATGIHALGLFPNIKAKDSNRWSPVGKNAEFIQSEDENMKTITVEKVYEKVMPWLRADDPINLKKTITSTIKI